MEDVESHFGRRDALYRTLGLPPVAFRGARVLEIAPGSGQNSLYVASCLPRSYELVEPNSTGRRDIERVFAEFAHVHTRPVVHGNQFEDFQTDEPFDIVICENWLGSRPHEVELIRKLTTLVSPGGALVLTIVPLSGFFANIFRRLLALRIVDSALDFEEKTRRLVDSFGPHLATINNMTRNHRDWVHDCLLNPHYLDVALPLETVVHAVGDEMELLATCPRFSQDWRWFKSLGGRNRGFNQHFLEAYGANLHNFIDYRYVFPPRSPAANSALGGHFVRIHKTALAWQKAFLDSTAGSITELSGELGVQLDNVATDLASIDAGLGQAALELHSVWTHPQPDAAMVRDMSAFASLFGRETIYTSLTRRI